jgi:hypothetical protein
MNIFMGGRNLWWDRRKEKILLVPIFSELCQRAGSGKQMSTIMMMLWKMIEILQMFLGIRSRWKKGLALEPSIRVRKWREMFDSFFEESVGFHNRIQANRKSSSGFRSFFLPYRVPLNLSASLPHWF